MNVSVPASHSSVASGQGKLLLLLLVALLPLVAALVMYFARIGLPASTTNQGQLVLPPLVEDDHGLLLQPSSIEGLQADGRRKWLMLVLSAADAPSQPVTCDATCRQVLYIVRQVNVALGKDADRVGHMLIAPASLADLAVDDASLLRKPLSTAERERLLGALAERQVAAQPWSVLLMDPLGNIMMHYPATLTGKDILEDLKRLLKVSKIG